MSDWTSSDLPFAEQVAEIEHLAAANSILSALGKPQLTNGALEDGERRRFAYAIIIGRTSDADTLRQIAADCDNGDSGNNDLLCAIIRNPATPLDVLIHLAWNKYVMVSESAASSTRIPGAELERLARDGSDGSKMGVTFNPSTPEPVLAGMACDPNEYIRARLAYCDRTPDSAVAALRDDPDPWVREIATDLRGADLKTFMAAARRRVDADLAEYETQLGTEAS